MSHHPHAHWFTGQIPGEPEFTSCPFDFSSTRCFEREPLWINGTGFGQARWHSCHPSNSIKTLKGPQRTDLQPWKVIHWPYPFLICQLTLEGIGCQTLYTLALPLYTWILKLSDYVLVIKTNSLWLYVFQYSLNVFIFLYSVVMHTS